MLLFLSFVKYSSAFVQKHTDISFFMPLSRRFFLESAAEDIRTLNYRQYEDSRLTELADKITAEVSALKE